MHRTTMHRAPALISLIALAACTASAGDSAPRLATWSVSGTPTLQIGTAVALAGSGASPTEFSHIRGVVRVSTGEIVVADGDSRELRVFDAEGRFVRALSRKGGGPGEFQNLTRMQRARDTLVAFDGLAGTVSRFTLGSGFIDRLNYGKGRGPLRIYSVRGRLASGALLVSPSVLQVFDLKAGEVRRDSTKLGILHAVTSDSVTWLGTFADGTLFSYKEPEVRGGAGGGFYSFGPRLATGASGDVVWIGDAANREIELYDASGKRVGTATWTEAPRPLDAEVMDAMKRRELEAAKDARRRRLVEALYDPAFRPDHAPYFASFTAGPHGEMWVERFREDPESPATYIVFDSTGTPRAEVAMPTAIDLEDVGEDYLLGVLKDADGVETVAEYGLGRGEKE